MVKTVIWIVLLGILGYGSVCLLLYLRQRSMIYYPHGEVKNVELAPLWLHNGGHKIKVWQLQPGRSTAVLYFGGNAENVLHSADELSQLFPDSSLYLMNYRGYGGSGGSPSEEALFSDALALFDQAASSHDRLVVMGRSLGSGVAVYAAAQRPATALILVTPYASMVALARHYYPYLPVNPLLKDRYESDQRAAQIDIPVLALVAENDEVIPARISAALIAAFQKGQVEEVVIEGAQHNTIQDYGLYGQAIREFMNTAVGERVE